MNPFALSEGYQAPTAGVDHGLSPEADEIRSGLLGLSREAESWAISSKKAEALPRLDEAAETASAPDWDGRDAVPVRRSTYDYARQFLELLPEDLPIPDIYPEPDGDLAFEWDFGKRCILSISVAFDGTLQYAGLFGGSKQHGIEFLADGIPSPIWTALRRLAQAGQ